MYNTTQTNAAPPRPPKQKIILPSTMQNRIAAKLLPIENCCGSGCRKCNYGRWLKAENRGWVMLAHETSKRTPPYVWLALIACSFVLGVVCG